MTFCHIFSRKSSYDAVFRVWLFVMTKNSIEGTLNLIVFLCSFDKISYKIIQNKIPVNDKNLFLYLGH
jgi:hypothetical protein